MDIVFVALGIVTLYYGGEVLVRGSVGLSLRHGLSPMVIGLTVMALGTSAPELFVSLKSAWSGHGDIAFGNVVGSNIANVLLVLGLPALFFPIATDKCDGRREWFEMFFATLLFVGLVSFSPFGLWQGIILLIAFIIIIIMQLRRARRSSESFELDVDDCITHDKSWKIWALIIGGVILLQIGARALVDGAASIAQQFDVPEAIIGLTIVALGTSLPELAASISAARKGETEMAIGNVLGSNLFNLLLVLGATGIVSTITVSPTLLNVDIPFMAAVSLAMAIFIFGKIQISRIVGIIMVAVYFGYIGFLVY